MKKVMRYEVRPEWKWEKKLRLEREWREFLRDAADMSKTTCIPLGAARLTYEYRVVGGVYTMSEEVRYWKTRTRAQSRPSGTLAEKQAAMRARSGLVPYDVYLRTRRGE